MKRYILFIASEKGYVALNHLINIKSKHIGCVVTFEEINVDYDWSVDIQKVCEEESIPYYLWKNVKNNLVHLLDIHSITNAVAISWRYMIPLELNNYLDDGLIVFHDSLLPKYRGFAPTPTAVICGDNSIGVSAIFATDSVDEGNIILQQSIKIHEDMYIKEIIREQSRLYAVMLEKIIILSVQGNLKAEPQNHDNATYSIWRNVEDCHIDWSKSSTYLHRFIRAVSSPYPGAYTYMDNEKIIITQAQKLAYDYNFAIRDNGKIWSIDNGNPIVICGSGLLKIEKAIDQTGEIVTFNKVRCQLK